MLLKCCGMGVVILSCTLFGYSMSRDYIQSIKNIEILKKLLVYIQGEIQYKNTSIMEVLLNAREIMDGIAKIFLDEVLKKFGGEDCSLQDAWRHGAKVLNESKKYRVDNEDVRNISELGNELGIVERDTQIKNISNTINKLEIRLKELNETKNEKCKLYRVMGVMAGMFMVIIFV